MLTISRVSHAYGEQVSLHNVTLDVAPGEIVCLLGPSGCGKTTLLRIVAGLEEPAAGEVIYAGADICATPANRREFGLMFQDFALFPHMNVADNIAYGLRRRGLPRLQVSREVEALLVRVGLADSGDRDVSTLSGGQQQRVALARSLAPRPRLLMLDEPLGSLDAQLRDQLALELRQIIKDESLSAIYVTHDHREAYAVADRIAVMNIGKVEQVDRPKDLYRRPASKFVAQFLGLRNIYDIEHGIFARYIASGAMPRDASAKSVLIHPRGIHFGRDAGCCSMGLDGVLTSAVFRGEFFDVCVTLADDSVLRFPVPNLPEQIGAAVSIYLTLDALIPLDG